MSGRSHRQQWRRLSVIELVTMNKTTQPTGETEASARDLSDEDLRPVLEGDVGTDDGISTRTALRFNGKHRGVASDRKKYWRHLLNRARLTGSPTQRSPSGKGSKHRRERTTDHETLESPWSARGSRITTKPYGSFSGVPHVPFSGDLGGEASELCALSFDHVPAMSVSGFATAACAGDCGVEWHGNGRIVGGSCGSRLAL
jgi:hypothetical protein